MCTETINERAGLITMKGGPATLLGAGVKVGDKAPEFTAVDENFQPVKLSSFKGKTVLISAVPSLDTPVCALQTKRFNEEAAKLKDVQLITISEDLPFAQKRFCQAEKIGTIRVVSDTIEREFGLKYGLLIKGLSLLARCVIVIGKDGKVRYMDLVKEVTEHPDYEKALEAARKAV
ncbi:MAG: thiol peroxidase [Elusimicrobiota bacterium]|jgi:thiol peroxidase